MFDLVENGQLFDNILVLLYNIEYCISLACVAGILTVSSEVIPPEFLRNRFVNGPGASCNICKTSTVVS